VAYLYFKHVERRRRLEIVHQERLAAMEKGIPLPELPLDPPRVPKPPDPGAPLIHGMVWTDSLGRRVALSPAGPASQTRAPFDAHASSLRRSIRVIRVIRGCFDPRNPWLF
jgi:hypothetical protein